MLLAAICAVPAAASDAEAGEEVQPSVEFLEFLGALVEVEEELLGPLDLDALPEFEGDLPGDRPMTRDVRQEDEAP